MPESPLVLQLHPQPQGLRRGRQTNHLESFLVGQRCDANSVMGFGKLYFLRHGGNEVYAPQVSSWDDAQARSLLYDVKRVSLGNAHTYYLLEETGPGA